MNDKQYYVYIMANCINTVLYVGVTNDLQRRVYEHKNKLCKGFTEKYNVNKLVYYEIYGDAYTAISREKEIKGKSRAKKEQIVESTNPKWFDLYSEVLPDGY